MSEKDLSETWSSLIDAHRAARSECEGAAIAFQQAFEAGEDVTRHFDHFVAAMRLLEETRGRMVAWFRGAEGARLRSARHQQRKQG